MAIITLPAALNLMLNKQGWGIQYFDNVLGRAVSGGTLARRQAPPRWTTTLETHDTLTQRLSGQLDAFLLAFDGMVNQLALYDVKYSQPLGTMRGAMVLASSLAVGATSIVINAGVGEAGRTLLQGDRLQFGSGAQRQVIVVAADAVANGSGQIVITTDLAVRWAQSSGAAVVWDKPTALFRNASGNQPLSSRVPGALNNGVAIDLVESWE
jgi:hypothetical protein